MAIFEKGQLTVISEDNGIDLTKAVVNKNLSAVAFDSDGKFFYMTVDKILFSDPASAIRTVLEAHGYVPNLENILSCLDSFKFSAYIKTANKSDSETAPLKVQEYFPCIRFELPQKNKIGKILQSFYDELSKYETKTSEHDQTPWSQAPETKNLKEELRELKEENRELREQISELTFQLSQEQRSLSRASKALDSQRVLPDNAKICRIEDVDLKRRKVKVKCHRKVIDIPTHMLDRVPDYQARCLVTFDEGSDIPLGIIFFNNEELGDLEKRTADLLYVKGDTFKARDSLRNEFQIKAVNPLEADTIKKLSRGMKVVISISDGYIVRFSVLGDTDSQQFKCQVQEQFIVYDIARNQLVTVHSDNKQD
ncbi:MAG: hypothetical protein OQK75_00265 [Gammaproteobacteria bacterium]|nr:hypothetical protein [Gammaproteobacteria bacterium]MCW8986077.1 hypothetical protein [Gammaproteobacteria bacterium]